MSLYDRRTLLILPLALAACGFQPVYGPGGAAAALRDKVRMDEPDSAETYLLVRNLEDRRGRAAQPEYALSVKVKTDTEGQAITAADETTRYSLVGRAEYSLTRIATGEVIASG
ncbi:MAG: hypothetical protein D6826_05350, partial [Alphaproteobacteria bacterium]